VDRSREARDAGWWVVPRAGDEVADAQDGSVLVVDDDAAPARRGGVVAEGLGGDLPGQGGGDRSVAVEEAGLVGEADPGRQWHGQADGQSPASVPAPAEALGLARLAVPARPGRAGRAGGGWRGRHDSRGRRAEGAERHAVDEFVAADLVGPSRVTAGLGARDGGVQVVDDRGDDLLPGLDRQSTHPVGQGRGADGPQTSRPRREAGGCLGVHGEDRGTQDSLERGVRHPGDRGKRRAGPGVQVVRVGPRVEGVRDFEVGVRDHPGLDDAADAVVELCGVAQQGPKLGPVEQARLEQRRCPRQAISLEEGDGRVDPLPGAGEAETCRGGDLAHHELLGQLRGVQRWGAPRTDVELEVTDDPVEPGGQAGVGVLARIGAQTLVQDRRVALPHGDEPGDGRELHPQRPPRQSTRSHHAVHHRAEHVLPVGTEHGVEMLAEGRGRRRTRLPA
jgi:hypothetical protein